MSDHELAARVQAAELSISILRAELAHARAELDCLRSHLPQETSGLRMKVCAEDDRAVIKLRGSGRVVGDLIVGSKPHGDDAPTA